MNNCMTTFLTSIGDELHSRFEVYATVRDLVDTVDSYYQQVEIANCTAKYTLVENLNNSLMDQIKVLQMRCKEYSETHILTQKRSRKLRSHFVSEVGSYLADRQLSIKLQTQIHLLEQEVQDLTSRIPVAVVTNNHESPSTDAVPKQKLSLMPRLLLELDDTPLLHIFSFLHTGEVLNYAQVCRYVYRRIDIIFDIQSTIVKPDWGVLRDPISKDVTLTVAAPSPSSTDISSLHGEPRLSRDMIDGLTKRLTAQEMKVILGLAEKIKKQSVMIDGVCAERDDLSARLQNAESVKEFLVEKLKSAEMTIKSYISESNLLKKQSASDNEIISYLDLHVQDLESQQMELSHRLNQSQATLNLHVGSHTMMEEQLLAELEDSRNKFEKLDTSFKSQKKLLVKEVKALRSQVETLQLEKLKNSTRLQILKEALEADTESSNVLPKTSAGSSKATIAVSGYRKF